MKGTTMKYRAKRYFLGATKGMEFPINAYGNISLDIIYNATIIPAISYAKSSLQINPTQYPDDFELVEEPKYTDSDLDLLVEKSDRILDGDCLDFVVKAIAELKQSKEKK